jgi:hypothetical protein
MHARDNPFSTARLQHVRYRFQECAWTDFLEQLKRNQYRGAIVGPEGSGKTTLLEDLEPKLRDLGFTPVRLRLTREAPRFSPVMQQMIDSRVSDRHILLFDGSEQMGWLTWKRFVWGLREIGGLIITRHRAGRLPVVHRCHTSPELLGQIARELLEGGADLSEKQVRDLFRKHRGNLRDALRDLYDRFALGRMTLRVETRPDKLAP